MTVGDLSHRRCGRARWPARRKRRWALLAATVAVCVLASTAGWVGCRGWQARGHLLGVASLARALGDQLSSGDTARAGQTLVTLQQQAMAAREATAGWSHARHVPYAGDDLVAVRQVVLAVDALARQVFPRLLRVDVSALLPQRGQLDAAGLRSAARELVAADAVVRHTRTALEAVDEDGLVRQVRSGLTALRADVDRLAGLTGAAARAATLLPHLLGMTEERDYLLVSQNLAEVRATGGMWGAYAVLRVDKGRLRLARQGTAGDLGHFRPPVAGLSREMRALHTDLPGIYPADVNLTPHFPTAAALYREMVRRRTGVTADGVLAVDPVALSYLLRVTGPVRVPEFATLSADTVVHTLLSESYRTLDVHDQDEFFAAAASTVFDALFRRRVDPRALVSVFSRSIAERRILFWSAHPDEQQALVASRIAGVLPDREGTPTVGVFLNDGTAAKLSYYLKPTAVLSVGACRPDGRRELRLQLTLRSSAPTSGLTASVLGARRTGDPYVVRTLALVFSPVQGAVVRARLDGVQVPLGSGTERRRHVGVATLDVEPGGTRTLEVDLLTAPTGGGAADLWLTPVSTPWTTHLHTESRCDQ